MKVVHVTASLNWSGAGVFEAVRALTRAQRERGADVTVVGLRDARDAVPAGDWHPVPVVALPVVGPASLGYAPKMARELVSRDPQIVHLHGLWMHSGRSVLQWQAMTGRPFVVSPHGMLAPDALSFSRHKKAIAGRLYQNSVFRKAAGFCATSSAEKAQIERYKLSAPIHVAANGVTRMDPPREALHRKSRTVLSLGRIHPVKGLDTLIAAWSKLEGDFPDWDLVIAGPDEGGERERLRGLARSLGLARVTFAEAAFGTDKVALMAGAELFVLPSRSENFALTVAEALMLGTPAIVSRGAPWPGLERERCGLWVDLGADPLERALRDLMTRSPAGLAEMGERGRAWMLREFSWEAAAERTLDCYRSILESAA